MSEDTLELPKVSEDTLELPKVSEDILDQSEQVLGSVGHGAPAGWVAAGSASAARWLCRALKTWRAPSGLQQTRLNTGYDASTSSCTDIGHR